MITRVTARACANIALIKYWGKQPGKLNAPATPSISLTLKKLRTETVIERINKGDDRFFLNGKSVDVTSFKRLKEYLNFWRRNKLVEGNFLISSVNNFPTKSGLASSSSGYAALAIGLSAFSTKKIGIRQLSKLTRIGSGSAARSIIGGLAAMPNAKDPSARLLLPPDQIPWGMVIIEIDSNEKEISSRQGMILSRKTSSYFKSWISQAEKDYRSMIRAISRMDFQSIGEIMEANMLAMHSCMIATRPSLWYWTPATVKVLDAVKRWRRRDLESYATIDAGPHVVLLARKKDLGKIVGRARKISGVKSAVKSVPGEGASIISWD